MIRALRGRLVLAALLLAAGCTSPGEKEAQLEFERLRARPLLPQGDRVLPTFGNDPVADDSQSFTHLGPGALRQP